MLRSRCRAAHREAAHADARHFISVGTVRCSHEEQLWQLLLQQLQAHVGDSGVSCDGGCEEQACRVHGVEGRGRGNSRGRGRGSGRRRLVGAPSAGGRAATTTGAESRKPRGWEERQATATTGEATKKIGAYSCAGSCRRVTAAAIAAAAAKMHADPAKLDWMRRRVAGEGRGGGGGGAVGGSSIEEGAPLPPLQMREQQ